MNEICVEIKGKQFKSEFNKENYKEVFANFRDQVRKFVMSFDRFSRYWRFPIVYINYKPLLLVCVNGTLKQIEKWEMEKIELFHVKHYFYPKSLAEV